MFPCNTKINYVTWQQRRKAFTPLLLPKALASSFAFALTFPSANGLLRAVNQEEFGLVTLLGLLSFKCG